MPDEIIQDQTVTPDQVKTPEQIEAEIKAKLESELSAKFKAEIAGLNRANSELKKAKDELESKTLTAEELAKKQKAELDAELEAVKRQSIQYKRDLIIDKSLNELGIPLEFSKRVIGEDEETIKEDVKALKAFIDSEVARRVLEENKARFGGTPPVGAALPQPENLQTAYNKAVENRDFAMATAIQRHAIKSGEQIITTR